MGTFFKLQQNCANVCLLATYACELEVCVVAVYTSYVYACACSCSCACACACACATASSSSFAIKLCVVLEAS